MSKGFQPLRTPTMVTGPAAAVISQCQRQGQAALCFAVMDGIGEWDEESSARAFECTRKPLEVLAGDLMISPGACGAEKANGYTRDTGNLYV